MTPFEAVYGRPPPPLVPSLPSKVRVQALADSLRECDEVLAHLREHLTSAQQHLVPEASKHWRPLKFAVGDRVYLRCRPYRQPSLFPIAHAKLAPRYFGPFEVEARIGATMYRLKLPTYSKIHPVFHVSLLKLAVGSILGSPTLPEELLEAEPPFIPTAILQRRSVERNGEMVEQVLIQWHRLGEEDSSWIDMADLRG
ncbi:uncharacterized protein LOC131008170 [Salvia miltiorrhiza]|uniref:uncharacterized protein LOC131008170 n=1 Tax=Salvia miltiorrhiza TaxID=226208 RepID=UPI0025AD6B7A|nr:uncharacterized protein LOC131008170 [Salvia miltiorrhiza]